MKNKNLNAVEIWKQMEDLAVPRLRLSVIERVVYSHLLRHSRVEGKQELHFSIQWLARSACLSTTSVRKAVRSLVAKGALRLAERSRAGHTVEVRVPEEIPSVRAEKTAASSAARVLSPENFEEADFLESRALREAIHAREDGRCFYCLHRLTPKVRCIDHVVPCPRKGGNSYRNLVSACMECNSQKGERRAEDFLRWLYREGRLTAAELKLRLRQLGRLASGKLRPHLPGPRPKRSPGSPQARPIAARAETVVAGLQTRGVLRSGPRQGHAPPSVALPPSRPPRLRLRVRKRPQGKQVRPYRGNAGERRAV